MRPNTRSTHVESTLSGENVAMTIDDDSMEHIMGLLTDLYADPEAAIIREYATNARDAHVEAGCPDRPIEVELPTSLRHVLVIRDYGPGLSAEDVRAIYSRYGASTKRGTNDATGMLGLGCKSALTYTDQFTVTAVKGGRRIAVAVSRDERGRGHMTVLDDSATDDPSGVEVSIPVKRDNDLADKAEAFFAFWPKGSVLLDGAEPESVWDREGYVPIGDNILARPSHRRARARGGYMEAQGDLIVQGGVAYPTDYGIDGVSLIAFVPIGSVDFAPSREAVMDTKATRAAIERVKAEYAEGVGAAVQSLIDGAADRAEALNAWVNARWLDTQAAPRWNGADVPTDFGYPDGTQLWVLGSSYRTYYGSTRGRGAHAHHRAVTIEQAGQAYWITGFSNTTWSATMRDKLDGFLADRLGEDNVGSTDGSILTPRDEPPHADWIDPERVFTWEDVRKFKLPSPSTGAVASTSARRVAGTYNVFPGEDCTDGRIRRTSKYPADDLAKSKRPLYYVEGGAYDGHHQARVLATLGSYWNLAVVPGNRLAKFKRTFPKAVSFREGVEAAALKWWRALDADEQALLVWQPSDDETEAAGLGIDPDALSDRVLAERLELIARKDNLPAELTTKWETFFRYIPLDERNAAQERTEADHIIGEYPVLTRITGWVPSDQKGKLVEHLTLYANAAFSAAQQ